VEDNPVNRAVVSRHLRKLGYIVETASTGDEALERSGAERFDLALMDCQLSGMDGFETTRAIRAREAPGTHLPIVALSADFSPEDRARCLAAGMDAHLTKPFKTEELRDTLQRWLLPPADRVGNQTLT
jgi:two-component system sensor histidine kinase/response regulator